MHTPEVHGAVVLEAQNDLGRAIEARDEVRGGVVVRGGLLEGGAEVAELELREPV